MADDIPIVCTLQPGEETRDALQQYRALFADALVSAERTATGVRWTLRADDGVEARVRALAALEEGCCAFLRMGVAVDGHHVVWDVSGPESAREFLDGYIGLADGALDVDR